MYISIDMCNDRQENKNVGTFSFVHLYIINQHCLWNFQRHDLSMKDPFREVVLNANHGRPTSDESRLGQRRSPIRGVVRERKYYYREHPCSGGLRKCIYLSICVIY